MSKGYMFSLLMVYKHTHHFRYNMFYKIVNADAYNFIWVLFCTAFSEVVVIQHWGLQIL